MPLLFGKPDKKSQNKDNSKNDARITQARDAYLAGKLKIVTTDEVSGREVQGTFGLIVCRGYIFDNAFYGLIAQALDVNADAILCYRESVAFHPEGDKFYSCYGTAVRLKTVK